jgi:hypothetical protein
VILTKEQVDQEEKNQRMVVFADPTISNLIETLRSVEAERDTFKRSHDALVKLERMVRNIHALFCDRVIISLCEDRQSIALDVPKQSDVITAPSLISAIESVKGRGNDLPRHE